MLRWTTAGEGPRFGLIVHHTDAEREYAYDRNSPIGRLERALDEAPARGPILDGCHERTAGAGPPPFARARAAGEEALAQLGLSRIADRPAGVLSHGDQRLLEVAMAMAQEPKVLLLDEPTQGLSVEETAEAVETLAQFLDKARLTVLLVEHDMEVVFRLAHRITVLHRGAVIADGTPATVKANARVQEAYLGGVA